MFFLLRLTFWLGLVLILLPSGSAQPNGSSEVSTSEAISAASATVGDLRGFCTRQPDACTVGSQVATAIGYKAQAGAKMLYDFLSEALASHDAGSHSGESAKSVFSKPSSQRASQNTLTPTDLAPTWRGPPARKTGTHPA